MVLPFVSMLPGEAGEQELHLQHHVTRFKISVYESQREERLKNIGF